MKPEGKYNTKLTKSSAQEILSVLQELHGNGAINARLHLSSDLGKYNNIARKLTLFLRWIKKKYSKINLNSAEQLLTTDAVVLLKQNSSICNRLFNYSDSSAYKRGQQFEEDFCNVINMLAQKEFGQNIVEKTGTNLTDIALKFEKSFLSNSYLTRDIRIPESDEFFKFYKTQQKTDIQGLRVDLSTQITNTTQRMLGYLNTYRFSLKTYNGTSIRLGSSKALRSYASVLSALLPGKDSTVILDYAYRLSYNHKNKLFKETKLDQHRRHLKFIYELTGAGQQGRNDLGVDFLIVNKSDGDEIVVISTKQIILNELNNGKSTAIKDISYTVNYNNTPTVEEINVNQR